MTRDRFHVLSFCAVGSTNYIAGIEPEDLGSNHQDWTRLPLIGDASHLLNRGRTFLSAVCHALASRHFAAAGGDEGQEDADNSDGSHERRRSLCTLSLHIARVALWHHSCVLRVGAVRKHQKAARKQARAEKRARKAHVSAFVLVPRLRPLLNVCCQASRRAKRAAKEEEILAQSALSFREAFGWLERCVPVALSRGLSLL